MSIVPPPLVLGGVGLVRGSVRDAGPKMVEVSRILGPRILAAGWRPKMPFHYVHLILRFGEAKPDTEIRRVSARYKDLPIARELSMDDCRRAAREGRLLGLFLRETLKALEDVAKRYELDAGWIEEFRKAELGAAEPAPTPERAGEK
jgi:hypothetical protein